MTWNVGAVQSVPATAVTGRAVTAGREVFTNRAADAATIGIVTATTGVVNLWVTSVD